MAIICKSWQCSFLTFPPLPLYYIELEVFHICAYDLVYRIRCCVEMLNFHIIFAVFWPMAFSPPWQMLISLIITHINRMKCDFALSDTWEWDGVWERDRESERKYKNATPLKYCTRLLLCEWVSVRACVELWLSLRHLIRKCNVNFTSWILL